jgi:hypothetical protein
MNNNIQPAAIANGQGQQASLPALSDQSLFNTDPSNIDFFFDEKSGNFLMDFKKPTVPDQSTTTDANVVNQNTATQQQAPNEPDKYETRFSTIENAIIRIAQSIDSNQGQVQPVQDTKEELKLDLQSDDFTTNLVNIINQTIEKKLEATMAPINKNMGQVNDRMLLTDLSFKYGQAFTDLLPAMIEYKKSDPNANWETMFNAMNKIPKGKPDSTTLTTNGSNNTAQPQVDLAQRAQQMATVRDGVSSAVVTDKPQGKLSIAQIVEQSIQELTGR